MKFPCWKTERKRSVFLVECKCALPSHRNLKNGKLVTFVEESKGGSSSCVRNRILIPSQLRSFEWLVLFEVITESKITKRIVIVPRCSPEQNQSGKISKLSLEKIH